ncbi:MAG: mechanosensitive ion channel family protein [Tannerella sp.]|jgi:miniconductance mechanosensitive channel|nr:mechanosensitive ion channel family protein [Tannerella sp.]
MVNPDSIIASLGIQSESLVSIIKVSVSVCLSVFSGYLACIIIKKIAAKIVFKIVKHTKFAWDNLLFDQKLFDRLGLLVFPMVSKQVLSGLEWEYAGIITGLFDLWIVFSFVAVISAVLSGVNRVYMSFPASRDKPIKVFIQMIETFLYFAAVIVAVGLLTGKDVSTLLTGLTAFAAVLMLIFKDSILGLVAGIQLSANNMVRIGDWIVMPSSGADGDVTEISLTTVKVQNFDKTITTIPTYKLVSESFTNWRGMEESNGRRIKRSINIDVGSIHYLTEEEISTLIDSSLLNSYMQKKLKDLEEFNASRKNRLDVRKLTNIGTFREYLESWIAANPDINREMTHMVRQLQPTPTGLPIEIYCFSAHQRWIDYENVQSDIFDHVYAVLDLFNLKAFQFSGNAAIN